jgi:hypothetical protein
MFAMLDCERSAHQCGHMLCYRWCPCDDQHHLTAPLPGFCFDHHNTGQYTCVKPVPLPLLCARKVVPERVTGSLSSARCPHGGSIEDITLGGGSTLTLWRWRDGAGNRRRHPADTEAEKDQQDGLRSLPTPHRQCEYQHIRPCDGEASAVDPKFLHRSIFYPFSFRRTPCTTTSRRMPDGKCFSQAFPCRCPYFPRDQLTLRQTRF